MIRSIVILLVLGVIVGCASTWDHSSKYRDFVGKQFVTSDDYALWKMKRHEYDLVPYTLQPIGWNTPALGTKIAIIPSGTVVKVRAVKLRYSGGDWDILLGELKEPGTNQTVVFELMLGFSSVDPKEVLKWLVPLK